MDTRTRLKIHRAKKAWKELGEVMYENGYTQSGFKHFPPGTDSKIIWHWFEEYYDVSVRKLMYGLYCNYEEVRDERFC